MFKKYRVQIRFRDLVLGGIPKAKELLIPWLRGRGVPSTKARELAEEIEGEVEAVSREDLEMAAWTTFKRDKEGIYLEERQVNWRHAEPSQTGPSQWDKPIRTSPNHSYRTIRTKPTLSRPVLIRHKPVLAKPTQALSDLDYGTSLAKPDQTLPDQSLIGQFIPTLTNPIQSNGTILTIPDLSQPTQWNSPALTNPDQSVPMGQTKPDRATPMGRSWPNQVMPGQTFPGL